MNSHHTVAGHVSVEVLELLMATIYLEGEALDERAGAGAGAGGTNLSSVPSSPLVGFTRALTRCGQLKHHRLRTTVRCVYLQRGAFLDWPRLTGEALRLLQTSV